MSYAWSNRSASAAVVASRTASWAMETAAADCELLGCPAYRLRPRMSAQNFSKVCRSSSPFIDVQVSLTSQDTGLGSDRCWRRPCQAYRQFLHSSALSNRNKEDE